MRSAVNKWRKRRAWNIVHRRTMKAYWDHEITAQAATRIIGKLGPKP